MFSPQVIGAILSPNDLSDLGADQVDSDISILLDWLKLSPLEAIDEPSGRVKTAIKSVLKTDASQLQFTKLFINSVNTHFTLQDVAPVLEAQDFLSIVAALNKYKSFYDYILRFFSLNHQCANMFNKNLNSKFKLVFGHPAFSAKLQAFFTANMLVINEEILQVLRFFGKINLNNDVNQIVIKIAISKLKSFIADTCTGVWDRPCLSKINNWIKVNLYPNLSLVLKLTSPEVNFFNHLLKISYNELISLRVNEIYPIVTQYPQSKVCLVELNKCLSFKLDIINSNSINFLNLNSNLDSEFWQRNKLVENFLTQSAQNLLNAGVNTTTLIKVYIRIIQSFLIVDPKGVLLDKVIRPIRKYIKTRDDIISKLVHGLLNFDDANELDELAVELKNTEKTLAFKRSYDEFDNLNWVPDPIDALPDFKKNKINDIIESLISIFDTKDVFITEFTKIFGHRLINLKSMADLKEILDSVSLLKIRFGKGEFFNLDIMIKDIINSDQFNSNFRSPFRSLILSHLYWSDIIETNDVDEFQLHPTLYRQFEQFNDYFKSTNYNRYLRVLPKFGSVKLTLSLADGDRQFEVSPDKASIIYLFDGVSTPINLQSVCEQLKMSNFLAKQSLDFWVQHQVLLEVTPGNYVVNE